MRELFELLDRFFVVGHCRLNKFGEITDALASDANFPPTFSLIPRNTFISARVVRAPNLVSVVLRHIAKAKIFFSVVQRVVVDVIHVDISRGSLKNLSMHEDDSLCSWFPSLSVRSRGIFLPSNGGPIELRKIFKILNVNFGYFTLSERDDAVRLVKRLNNRLAAHAMFGHDSTSNGIAVFSRFSIVSGGSLCLSSI